MSTENSAMSEPISPVPAESEVQPEAQNEAPLVPQAELETQTQGEPEPTTETTSTLPISELRPKMQLTGTVKRIELFGAFVDVGVGVDGLLHISQIQEEPVKNVNDVLSESQEVTVWVRNVDAERGRIDLTMIEPPGMYWSEIRVGQVLTGKVVRVEKFGAFIDVGAERPGMVHVSELSSGYVGAPGDVVKVGEEVQAKVIKVNSRKKQIDLSIKALEMPAVKEQQASEDDDKVPTAMELALRRALQGSDEGEFPALERALKSEEKGKGGKGGKQAKREKRTDKHRQEQEALLSRTLAGSSERNG